MLRYQGVDWRDDAHWNCNAKLDPQQESTYDGTSLNPLEVPPPPEECPCVSLFPLSMSLLWIFLLSADAPSGSQKPCLQVMYLPMAYSW